MTIFSDALDAALDARAHGKTLESPHVGLGAKMDGSH